jgi:hypothetical protein
MRPLHDRAASSLLLRGVWVLTLVDLTPYGWYHEIARVVAVVDQRQSSLGHLDTRPVEVLLQPSIELSQTTVLEIGHTLLLVLDITTRSELVGRHFDDGWSGDETCETREVNRIRLET